MDKSVPEPKGVKTLLGDPRRAVLKISMPMIIGMLSQTIYNIVDGIWVAGLGKDALAAIGLFFPPFMVMLALAAGIGVGGSSAVSRGVGEKDRAKASSVAEHTLLIGLVIALFLMVVFFFGLRGIFGFMGAQGSPLEMAVEYGKIIALGSIFLVFSHIGSGILRGEGDAKKAMLALIVGSCLNIILDPLFIYTFKMGIKGAALATVVSIAFSSGLIANWLFLKKSTYVAFNFRGFSFSKTVLAEILKVGIPTSFGQASMALAMFVLSIIVLKTSGSIGVAVFTAAWRIIMIGIVPLLGVASAVVAVTGAAFGARDVDKLKRGYLYAVKAGVVMELAVAFLVFIFAPKIALLFTYSEASKALYPHLVTAMRILVLFLPGAPFGMLTSSMFQGVGKGINSFIVTIYRTLIMQVFFSWLIGIALKYGMVGVWIGIVLGNLISAAITFNWGRYTIRGMRRRFTLSKVPATVAQD